MRPSNCALCPMGVVKRLLLRMHMSRKSPHISSATIAKLISQGTDDPDAFDSLMTQWNALFELQAGLGERSFADVEAAALSTIGATSADARPALVGRKVAEMLETFESPVFLVRENGKILAQNTSAVQAFDLSAEASLGELPLDLEADVPIADAIRAALAPGANSNETTLIRAYWSTDDSPLTLSIIPSKLLVEGRGEALVFVVDARWKTAATDLIKREFELTKSECQLLAAFLDGQTTQDMAASRNRSHATIRTQFHNLMTKMGARSQTELFRNALSVSQFVDKVEAIADVLRHPHRKRVNVMRPGGRSVEITLSGDFNGQPFVFINSTVNYTFERKIEQIFFEAGICIFSICRPSTGDTDPPMEGVTAIETSAQDIEAVMDQLGHSKFFLMTSNLTIAFMYRVAQRLSERLHGIIQLAAPVPVKYQHVEDETVPWAMGMVRAVKSHPFMADFIVKSGVTAWVKMGPKAFMKLQFMKHKDLLHRVLQPEPMAEHYSGFNAFTAQGTATMAYDVKSSYHDFSDDIRGTSCPILVVHGTNDEMFPIGPVRKFAADFKGRVSFIELHDAGWCPLDTHALQIVAEMTAFAKSCDA